MKVTLAVDAERIVLTSPDGYTTKSNVVTLTEKTREWIREWKQQERKVDVLIEYGSDSINAVVWETPNKVDEQPVEYHIIRPVRWGQQGLDEHE